MLYYENGWAESKIGITIYLNIEVKNGVKCHISSEDRSMTTQEQCSFTLKGASAERYGNSRSQLKRRDKQSKQI